MNTIEIKNFRNFVHLEPLSLNDVTILVGPNNSGKSTITKAFRLLGENLHKIIEVYWKYYQYNLYAPFDFSNVCGNFKRALSTKAQENVIEFTLGNEMFDITIQIKSKKDSNSSFADISFVKITDKIDDCIWQHDLNKKMPTPLLIYSGKFLANLTRIKKTAYEHSGAFAITRISDRMTSEESQKFLSKVAAKRNISVDELNSEIALYKQFHIIEKQYETLSDTFFEEEMFDPRPFEGISKRKFFLDGQHTNLVEGDIDIDVNDDLSIKLDADTKILKSFFDFIKRCLVSTLNKDKIVYIPANEATGESYFKLSDTDNTDYSTKVINFFYKQNRGKHEWVKTLLNKMGLCEDFSIKQVNSDFLYVSITKQSGEELPLADFGKGIIQLFLKILHIANVCHKDDIDTDLESQIPIGNTREDDIISGYTSNNLSKKIVIFEEPEQNLHPALQSKLADLFLEVSKLGVNVLVETHSEYLVRRSQVLVAEAKYKDEQELEEKCPFKVYYFPETGKGQPYDMEYRVDGKFNKKFGKGFFDVADGLMLDLL